jgi:lipoprotein-anchoring transpeptidase ErfK/SrfK
VIKKILACLVILFLILIAYLLFNRAYRQDSIDPNNLVENYDNNIKTAIFNNQEISISNNQSIFKETILGDTTENSNKKIEVNLSEQRLYAYENDVLKYTFLVSSGKWDRTPNGNFKIWIKVRSQKMSGGSKEFGTYYYLPNVPFVMFFYNEKYNKTLGYSFHGTYWHNNFGVPMSHGCINLKTEDAKTLYSWADVGTPVTIFGKYTKKI